MSSKSIAHHQGKKVKHIRNKIFGWKQEVLADKIGLSQQAVSLYESMETLDPAALTKMLQAFGISLEFFNNYSPEATEVHIENSTSSAFNIVNNESEITNNINPIDEIVKLTERILNDKEALYNTFTSTLEELRKEIDSLKK